MCEAEWQVLRNPSMLLVLMSTVQLWKLPPQVPGMFQARFVVPRFRSTSPLPALRKAVRVRRRQGLQLAALRVE